MKTVIRTAVLLSSLGFPAAVQAQDTTEQAEFQRFLQEQQQGVDDLMRQYEEFERQQELEFHSYVRDVEQKWREFQGSTKKEWIDYSGDKDAKSYVNFEEGKVEVEAVAPASDPKAREVAEKKLLDKVQSLVSNQNPSGENVLAGQVIDAKGKPVTQSNARDFSSEFARKRAIVEVQPVTGKDGVERLRLRVTFNLVPNHLKIRAERYLPLVRTYTKKYNLDPRWVFALMHTESYFNPMARSGAPAFGLMQLVPRSGAKDAYKYLYGEAKLVTPDYLYNPRNNIELGVSYIAMLRSEYFKGVKDIEKILYVVTAAYNTGAGNVSVALTGTKNVSKAIHRINSMSPKQLYDRLLSHLPYEETRNYVKLVTSRLGNYEEWKQ